MVNVGQWTVTPVPADLVNNPSLGAQVIRMDPISRGRMWGAVSVDGQDRWFGRSPMTPVGCSLRGLVLLMMLVSFSPHWRTTVRCVLCTCWIFSMPLAVHAIGSTCSQLNTLRVELDSHADTCVVGKECHGNTDHPNVVMVSGFDPAQPP
jgi:hypothetical protein